MSLRTSTPRLGTDGDAKLIPRSGDTQPHFRGSRRSRAPEGQRRTLIAYSLGLGVFAVRLLLGYGLESPFIPLVVAVATAVSDRWASVRLSETTDLTVSPVVTLFAAVLSDRWQAGLSGRFGTGRCRASPAIRTQSCAAPEVADLYEQRFISGALAGSPPRRLTAMSRRLGCSWQRSRPRRWARPWRSDSPRSPDGLAIDEQT